MRIHLPSRLYIELVELLPSAGSREMRELLSSKQEVVHMYKTFVIGYNPKAHKMAEEIEKKANELAQNGYKVLSFSITNSGKAIILADDEGGRDA
jgi:hypothetical protein